MAKKNVTPETFNLEEHHQNLNACINCIYELICEIAFPFPLNLEMSCDKYEKTELKKIIENEQA